VTNWEWKRLSPRQAAAVERCIAKARKEQGQHDDGGAYAYAVGTVIHWGFNGGPKGFCIARGVVPR
jgi:hypothetical protein